jgi:hypothetical protein
MLSSNLCYPQLLYLTLISIYFSQTHFVINTIGFPFLCLQQPYQLFWYNLSCLIQTSWPIWSHVYKYLRTFYLILTATSTINSRMNWNSHQTILNNCNKLRFLFACNAPAAKQPLVDQGLLIIKASRSHTDKPHSVPVAETSTWQHTTLTRDQHPCPRQDLQLECITVLNFVCYSYKQFDDGFVTGRNM